VAGVGIGSKELRFEPGSIVGGKFEADVGSAGSAVLVAQAVLPALFAAKEESEIRISGGTHVAKAPTFDYFEKVFLPALQSFGLEAEAKIERAGFYPAGIGRIMVGVAPGKAKRLDFSGMGAESGKIHAKIVYAKLPAHVAEREKEGIVEKFASAEVEAKLVDASCAGNAITLWSGLRGACAIGERGRPAEKVADEACGALLDEIDAGAQADLHLADQLMVYLAAVGAGELRTSAITGHARTNAQIISMFLPVRFKFEGNAIGVEAK
jgi:RNA 3'-terminal phosphate cyclase (ATP)